MKTGWKPYEMLDYPADIGLRIYGRDLEDLFRNAAYALFNTITDTVPASFSCKREFNISRDTTEELLVEWLNSLLYVFETELVLFGRFSVRIRDGRCLYAEAEGEPVDTGKHDIKNEIKAVTYHDLEISKSEEGMQARVVLDV